MEYELDFALEFALPGDGSEPVRDSLPKLRGLELEESPLSVRTLDRAPLISEPERGPPPAVPECDDPELPELGLELPDSPREELSELELPELLELDERLLPELLLLELLPEELLLDPDSW